MALIVGGTESKGDPNHHYLNIMPNLTALIFQATLLCSENGYNFRLTMNAYNYF